MQSVDGQRPRERGDASVVASAIAGGTLGASLSLLPSTFARPMMPRVPQLAVVGLIAGAGLGAASAGVANLTDTDGVTGGALLAGSGLVAAVAGARMPHAGRLRDAGSIVSSLGKLGVAGGAGVAGSSILRDSDVPGLDSRLGAGLSTGLATGALALGGLAVMGATRRAPTVVAAARTTLVPAAGSLDGITPQRAKAIIAESDAAARASLEALPGTDAGTWERVGTGRVFLRGVATADEIGQTSGQAALREPTRLFVGAAEAATPEARAQLMLERFDASGGAAFGTIHVASPDAMGGTGSLLPLAVEHGRRGDVITIMAQTSQVAPEKALGKVDEASRTLELVLRGIKDRLDELPPGQARPQVLVSGLCYGTLPIYKLRDRLGGSLQALGVDHTILPVGPALSRSVRRLAGQLDRGEVPGLHVRTRTELLKALERGDAAPEVLVQSSVDDPLRVSLPSMLVPFPMREKQRFVPVMSAVSSYLDSRIDEPIAGRMLDVGHRVEASATAAANFGFGLGMSRGQMAAVDQLGIRANAIRGIAKQQVA